MREHPDRELVERARHGDGAAIGELFSRYWRAARGAAFGVTGEFASAEDAAAEAFRQALVGMDSLRDPDRFGPWLRTIVVRQARLILQSRRRAMDALVDDLPGSNEPPDDALQRLELGALIQQSVRELPPRLREAVSLFYFEGYDSDDAASFLDIPAGTFRRRLHEGRRQLRCVAEEILKGSKRMNEEREREIERLKRLIDNADGGDPEPLYQALRQSMALRPPPNELMDSFVRRQGESAGAGKAFEDMIRETARRFTGPSDRASDPNHPVGSLAASIRQALPEFQEWQLDVGEAAAHFFSFSGKHRDRVQALLPPGFAEGRPGAFLRGTRALQLHRENGPVRTTYQLLQDSADHQAFRAGMNGVRLSDVLDLTWMVEGPLELRSVQELLERLIADVLPGTPGRFSHYDEPRYRSALQLQVGDVSAPAAHGGVLAEWAGHPSGVTAAHVRIFLKNCRGGHKQRIALRCL
jgi:RNA polymerase sigma-70 factor (ECF subfamily)